MGDISVHFNRSEFACKCGCGFDTVDTLLLEALESIRNEFEKPITVTSGCRCASHNFDVGGKPSSQHKNGRAADIKVSSVLPRVVADFAEDLGMSVGRYNTFTHIDSRSGPSARWGTAT
jgi:uncharacterized protein YcbK (DUF882 family)